MANLKDLIVNGAARIIGKTYSSEFVGNVTGDVTGNTATASKLKTAVSLTTTDGTHTSDGVSFDGSAATSIKLPTTIKATFSGNLTGDVTGNVSGNAGTATKLKTARSLKITDDGTNTSTGVDFDGSDAVTLKLPSTIKASLAGNATTATTADKTAYGISVKDAASNPAVDGWNGSTTGNLTITGASPITTTATANTITVTHDKKGPDTTTATSKGDTADQAPGFGGTFKATSATVDEYGHTTTLAEHIVTIPNSVATKDASGLMSAADKSTLDKVASTYAGSSSAGGPAKDFEAGVGTDNADRYVYFAYNDTTYNNSNPNSIKKGRAVVSSGFKYNPGADTLKAGKVWGAVFNDLADAIPVGEGDVLEAGYCYGFDGEHYTKTSEYMQKSYIGIHSDTYGFKMGHEEGKEKLNVAVSGFVLAYVDKEYEVGTPLTCTEDGCLTEIKLEDKIKYPERVVATYWKNEPNEEWGPEGKKVRVNGRRWVKVK